MIPQMNLAYLVSLELVFEGIWVTMYTSVLIQRRFRVFQPFEELVIVVFELEKSNSIIRDICFTVTCQF